MLAAWRKKGQHQFHLIKTNLLTLVKQIVYRESSDFVSLNRLCVPSVGVCVCVCMSGYNLYNCSVIVGRREEKDGWWISWKLSSFLTLFEIILIWGVLARNKRSLLFWHHLSCCIIMCQYMLTTGLSWTIRRRTFRSSFYFL